MEVGKRIQAWRKIKGMTQVTLAERAGISAAAISYFESGASGIVESTLTNVVKALGLTMERFYGRIPKARA